MKLFGFEIQLHRKQYPQVGQYPDNRGGWYPVVHEPYTGAWQRNDEHYRTDAVLSNAVVFRCITLIANSIAKMELRLVQKSSAGIWSETEVSAFSPVLRQPNSYQNSLQFIQNWVSSLMCWGNMYALKGRDDRNVVTDLYVLDPTYVRPLIAPDGEVFYELKQDYLADINEARVVPASEIIHDRINALYHPLVGLSPIYAAGLPAIQAQRIQTHSERFFANGAQPGGMLTAPTQISKEDKMRLKEQFTQNYSGNNVGRLFIADNGLKYEPFKINAVDSQLIEQLKWTSETICAAFGVPGYKVGVGATPSYNNIEALERGFYADCLQILIEQIERSLDLGLELPKPYGTEFNRDDLLGMDQKSMADTIAVEIGAGVLKPNEGRKKLNYEPVEGGDTPYLQQQNYSLAALNKRDTQENPFAPAQPSAPAPESEPEEPESEPEEPEPTPRGGQILRNFIAAKQLARMEQNARHS